MSQFGSSHKEKEVLLKSWQTFNTVLVGEAHFRIFEYIPEDAVQKKLL